MVMAKIKFIYGTGGGNTEMVCNKVAAIFKKAGHKIEIVKAKLASAADVSGADVYVFASPTYGHGQLEQYFAKFFDQIQDLNLKGVRCLVISLGDRKYDIDYCMESGKILTKFLRKKEAEMVHSALMIEKTPVDQLNGYITKWAKTVCEKLTS